MMLLLLPTQKKTLQHCTFCVIKAIKLLGQEISFKKTEVNHRPTPREEYRFLHITIDETLVNACYIIMVIIS